MWAHKKLYTIPRVLNVQSICTAFHEFREQEFYFDGEVHNFWELVFISQGSAAVARDDKIFTLHAGDVVLHRPMEFHRLWSEGDPFWHLVISFAADGEVIESLAEGIFSLNMKQQTELTDLVQQLRYHFQKEAVELRFEAGDQRIAQELVLRLELFLLQLLQNGKAKSRRETSQSAAEFARLIQVMNQHLSENLSLSELAQRSRMSVSSMKKICQKYTGGGVAKHFLRLRLMQAVHLLEQGMSVNETAEHMGFSSQNYFSYVVRRELGKPPKDFKK